jgi:hypothetical protein
MRSVMSPSSNSMYRSPGHFGKIPLARARSWGRRAPTSICAAAAVPCPLSASAPPFRLDPVLLKLPERGRAPGLASHIKARLVIVSANLRT